MLPILYSFRRCPYAIRARMALNYSGVNVELREVILSNKPEAMLSASPKGTVPVLVLADKRVIDESRDIIVWALEMNDPDGWMLQKEKQGQEVTTRLTVELIEENDFSFKPWLDRYKYHERYPEHSMTYYRSKGEDFLKKCDAQLNITPFLFSDRVSMADIAIFPFVRQFALVDFDWFSQTAYRKLQIWLQAFLVSELFISVMQKHPPWIEGEDQQLS